MNPSRNGKDNSQMNGKSTAAKMATGQHSTRSRHQHKNTKSVFTVFASTEIQSECQ